MKDQSPRAGEATRRAALSGVGLAGVAVLAGCSTSSSSTVGAATPATTSAASPSATGAAASSSAAASASDGGTALGPASEIAVGGGKVFKAAKVVVTQPSAGEYKGFSAVCTHQQCLVDQVADGTINCPCHGSKYSVKDGSVVAGPAPSPLPTASVTVSGGQVKLA